MTHKEKRPDTEAGCVDNWTNLVTYMIWVYILLYFHYNAEPITAITLIVLVICIIIAFVVKEHLTTTPNLCIGIFLPQLNTLPWYTKIICRPLSHFMYQHCNHFRFKYMYALFDLHSDILTGYKLSRFACLGCLLTKLYLFLIYQYRPHYHQYKILSGCWSQKILLPTNTVTLLFFTTAKCCSSLKFYY